MSLVAWLMIIQPLTCFCHFPFLCPLFCLSMLLSDPSPVVLILFSVTGWQDSVVPWAWVRRMEGA